MLAEVWYQNPIVVVAGFAFVTAGLTRFAKVRDDRKLRVEKLEDEKLRKLEKVDDEKARIAKEQRDNARQDEVAARVAEAAEQAASAARLLVESNADFQQRADMVAVQVASAAEIAAGAATKVQDVADTAEHAAQLLVESNLRSQARDAAFVEKLDKIGLSADGTLTAALKAQLLALRGLQTTEQNFKDYRIERGGQATPQTEAVLVATEAQIAALTEEIADREAAGLAAVNGATPADPTTKEHTT